MKENRFCQFIHDGAALLNKHKHQAFVVQFSDSILRHNNFFVLLFIKALSIEHNIASALVEEACDKLIDKLLNEIFF